MENKDPSDYEVKTKETEVAEDQAEKATRVAAKKPAKKRPEKLPHARERAQFRALLMANPNYFGNLEVSPFMPVLPIAGNPTYEQLACVGYHPQQKRLEAVVYLYQPSGYLTDICGSGSPEYVRFYLSFDNGVTWQDQGMTSFQAYNIPEGTEGGKRLEYAVSRAVDPNSKFCFFDPLIRVRAILSWNNPPPKGVPNWTPVWGDVLEKTIQVEPHHFILLPEIFEFAEIKPPPLLNEIIAPDMPIQTKTKSLSAAELAVQYRNKGVPVHRFAFKEISDFVSTKTSLSAESFANLLPDITIDPGIIDLLFPKTDGDTSYEELKCIGLDPNHPDTLVGVIQVKKSLGYSGGPCTDGSLEYVTFWADFDGNGSFETCLGTASVRVYDLNVPPDGVYYAVRLPVNLNEYRQACKEGPKVVRLRAILSWNKPVSCTDPNKVPTWGNREETLINIAPSVQALAGTILNLGGISHVHIDDETGLTTPDAKFVQNNLPPDSHGRPCPFAGWVTVEGLPVLNHSYVVEVSQDGVVWTPVLTDLLVEDKSGILHPHKANPVTKRFDYLPFEKNAKLLLALWKTTDNAKWHVRLSVYNAAGVLQSTDTHLIQLDNTAPEVSITIKTGTGDCGKFPVGTPLSGKFVARDDNLGRYTLSVEPDVNLPGVGVPSPKSGLINTSPKPGDEWKLVTEGMKSCGYVIRVVATDLAIINSQSVGHSRPDSAGFCLEEPKKG